jgi:hypothetical protein
MISYRTKKGLAHHAFRLQLMFLIVQKGYDRQMQKFKKAKIVPPKLGNPTI